MGGLTRPAIGILSLALLLLPGAATGQDAALRADLDRFRLDLSQLGDTALLRTLEHRFGSRGATAETEALRRLRRGLVRLRLGELGAGWSFGQAVGDFRRATELEPGWSYAWHGRGLAERAEGDWQAANRLNLGKRVGLGSVADALQSFAKAVEIDPHDADAAQALFDGAVAVRDTGQFGRVALPALRQAVAAGASDTGLLLSLGRAERLLGDPQAAPGLFQRYLDGGGGRGIGLRELAWSGFVAGSQNDSLYYAGAGDDDSASVAAYREDLGLIADSATLADFDQSRGAEREALLRRFWTDRARQALRNPAERLREHYRRLNYAERHFGLEVNRRYYSIDATDMYRSGSTRLDDRGIVYLRYGEPDERAATVTFDIQPNQTWVYRRADGDFLLHFAANAGGDIRDYRLVPSITYIGGVNAGNVDRAATFFAFNDRCELYPPFCKYLGWGPNGRAELLRNERSLVEASVSSAVSTDGFELHFAHGLQARAEAFAVGRENGGQLVHVAYQLGLYTPDSLPEQVAFRVPVRVRVNLYDDAGHSRGWVDTTTEALQQGGGAARRQVDGVGRVVVVVPSGRWHYQVALAYHDSIGRVLPSDSITVGNFDGSRLAVSDLVLSKGGRGARWVPAPGDTAYFNPRSTWSRADTIALYHEIYGLEPGAAYQATLVVRRGRRVLLSTRYEGVGQGIVTRVARTVSFATLKNGDYVIEVEVTGHDGATASAVRRIRITD
jgi:GWxTD domain-containing protein